MLLFHVTLEIALALVCARAPLARLSNKGLVVLFVHVSIKVVAASFDYN